MSEQPQQIDLSALVAAVEEVAEQLSELNRQLDFFMHSALAQLHYSGSGGEIYAVRTMPITDYPITD